MVAHHNQPADIHALRTVGGRPHNLPAQLTPLIGREREAAVVREQLRRNDVCLVTLTGSPGTGKTRLAVHVAGELVSAFAGGVWFVPLDTVREPRRVLSAIAQTLAVPEAGTRPLIEGLKDALGRRHVLLVLDNFEQVLAAAPLVAELLMACPALTCLVTSRAALRLRGEHEAPVPPLSLPALGDGGAEDILTIAAQSPAVQLFVARAQAVSPGFRLTAANARTIAGICIRLDGLPLAIELAAARSKALPPDTILERLEPRLPLLTGGARDLPARHQTLREAIAWGYDLLTDDEQRLFCRLGVFAGGCTLTAAETVAGSMGKGEWAADGRSGLRLPTPHSPRSPSTARLAVLDGLTALVDHSMLRQEAQADGQPRFRMLETVREFALERLAAPGVGWGAEEPATSRRRHAVFFLDLAERAEPELYGVGQDVWFRRLDVEIENIRAALAWLLESGEAESALRLAGALRRFWGVRGHFTEGRDWLERALAAGGTVTPAVRGEALNAAGDLARVQGDYAAARAHHEHSLRIFRDLDDDRKIAWSLDYLGIVLIRLGEYEPARVLFEEGLAIAERRGDKRQVAMLRHNIGDVAHEQGDHAAGRPFFEDSLVVFRAVGDRLGTAHSLNTLGEVDWAQGDYAAARACFAEALAVSRDVDNRQEIAWSLLGLAHADCRRGDLTAARAGFVESLAIRRQLGNKHEIAESLEGFATLAMAQSRAEQAVRLCGAAASLRGTAGVPVAHSRRASLAETLAAARATLGEKAFAAAWGAGQGMPADQAIALAHAATEPSVPDAGTERVPPDRRPAALTRREREIATLIARGLTNHQIAVTLVISERTADTHVGNILSKLGFATRAQIAAWVVEQGLLGPRPP